MGKETRWAWGERGCRWLVSAFFLFAAVPKLADAAGFAQVIKAYGIVPEPVLVPMAVVLPVIEILLALGLLMNRFAAKVGMCAMLLVFIAVLSYAIWMGFDIDCGCFGPADPESRAFHGLRSALARDVAMLLLLAFSLWYSGPDRKYTAVQDPRSCGSRFIYPSRRSSQ